MAKKKFVDLIIEEDNIYKQSNLSSKLTKNSKSKKIIIIAGISAYQNQIKGIVSV